MSHGVYRAIVNGVHARGEGGFLLVVGGECAYMFPSELSAPDEFRGTLSTMISDEASSHVFYVVEHRNGKLHVLAYPREAVLRGAVAEEGDTPTGAAPGEELPRVEEVE